MRQMTCTKAELAAALRKWEEDDKAGKCQPSDDPERHNRSADYLMDLIEKGPDGNV